MDCPQLFHSIVGLSLDQFTTLYGEFDKILSEIKLNSSKLLV
jgi:hypothetical protein